MNIGRVSTRIKRKASIIKETTGTARIIRRAGDRRISASLKFDVKIPHNIPPILPNINPKKTRNIVAVVAAQNSEVRHKIAIFLNTLIGEGKKSRRFSSTSRLAASQIKIQKAVADKAFNIRFKILFGIVVKIGGGHGASD